MRASIASLAILSLCSSTPLRAQAPDWVTEILTAARLPVVAAEARREGTPGDEVRAVLEAMARAKVPAHEATAVIDTARAVRREHGPTDNFGAFVQSQLAAGKRGRALASAIRAEHVRRGKGLGAHGAGEQSRGRSDTRPGMRPGPRADSQPPGRRPDERGRERKRPARPHR